jgi:hypothetical protein
MVDTSVKNSMFLPLAMCTAPHPLRLAVLQKAGRKFCESLHHKRKKEEFQVYIASEVWEVIRIFRDDVG